MVRSLRAKRQEWGSQPPSLSCQGLQITGLAISRVAALGNNLKLLFDCLDAKE